LTDAVFAIFLTVMILGEVLRGEEVTRDSIHGGICVYLLMGYAWALFYGLVEVVHPGSFSISGLGAGDPVKNSDLFFFSFVTLTTLGYGDMTPVSSQARSLAILEAVIGPLFIAVFIARLVGRIQTKR
jgi:hypothetical protein